MLFAVSLPAQETQEQSPSVWETTKWVVGPATANLGVAQIEIPEGYVFANGKDTQRLMESMGNPPSNTEVGFIAPDDVAWFVVFEYDEVGYVSDEEKGELDSDAILASIRQGTEEANKIRRQNGWSTLDITGWEIQPYYNENTHNLEWATRARDNSDGSVVLNHNTRILGRGGVMSAVLVATPEIVNQILPTYSQLLAGYDYKEGHRYSEWEKGDKIAEYGLTGLIVGGTAAAALKMGILQKFWKLILVGFLFLGGLFKKLIGRK